MQSDESLKSRPLSDLFTIGEAAAVAGVTRMTVHRWLKAGVVRGIQLAGYGLWMVPKEDIELAAQEAGTRAERVAARREAVSVAGEIGNEDVK